MKPTEAPKWLWVIMIKGLNSNRENNLLNLLFFSNIFSLCYINLYFHLDFKICCIHIYSKRVARYFFIFIFFYYFCLFVCYFKKKYIATHAFNFICKINDI